MCVCVFFFTVPHKPVGIENGAITDVQLSSSTTLNGNIFALHARLNALSIWCSEAGDPNSWLQVLLGKQYTLTHVAIQQTFDGDRASFNVESLTVRYEKTEAGENWITYSKVVNGTSFSKVLWNSGRFWETTQPPTPPLSQNFALSEKAVRVT